MNALAPIPQYHASLPDFLKMPALFSSASALTGGINGGTPPQISIKGSKWKLAEANGEELFVQQMHLDVIVVGGNEFVSKTFYEGEYDPNNIAPPDCWSDNGKGPSSQASKPQSASCASCPKAAFGSKISTRGTKVKACGDSKKLAVVLAAPTSCLINGAAETVEPFQQVYLLRVPAMSMGPWAEYAKDVARRGVPQAGVIVRLTFDPSAEYPKIAYQSVGFTKTEAEFNLYRGKIYARGTDYESQETAEIIGANDIPVGGMAQEVPAHLAALPAGHAYVDPAPVVQAVVQAPAPAPVAQQQVIPPAQAPAAATGRPRGRPARGAAPAGAAAAVAQAEASFAPAADPFAAAPAPVAAAPAAAPTGVIQQPAASDAGLDALLDEVWK